MSNGADSKSPIETAVAVLGVTAGLTAVAYFVGSVAIWMRLYIAHFPADIGLELASDGRIIAVGVRGIAVVAGIVALLLLMVQIYASHVAPPLGRFASTHEWTFAALWVTTVSLVLGTASRMGGRVFWVVSALVFVVGAAYLMLFKRMDSPWAVAQAAVAAVIAIAISAGIGWRLFGLVVALLGIVSVIALASRRGGSGATNWGVRRHRWKVPWWINLVIVALVAVAAITWQVSIPVSIATIRALPLINPDLLENPALPYFGSSGDFYYVACVVRQTDPKSDQPYEYLRPIVEVPRDQLTYVEFSQSKDLYPKIKTPAAFAWDWIQNVWQKVRGEEESEPDRIGNPPSVHPWQPPCFVS